MRNELLFRNEIQNQHQVALKSTHFAKNIAEAFKSNLNVDQIKDQRLIHWHFPLTGRIKIKGDRNQTLIGNEITTSFIHNYLNT